MAFAHPSLTPAATRAPLAAFLLVKRDCPTRVKINMHLFIVSIATVAALTANPKSVPYLPVPHDAAVMLVTGSTNTLGYRIVVQSDGNAEFVKGTERATARVSADLARALFADLEAAMPLSELHTGRCMKSASFGTSTFVYWRQHRSPDLSCAGESKAGALLTDVQRISIELKLAQPILRYLPTNEPVRPLPEPSRTR